MNRIPKDIMITRQDLIDWLDRPLRNEDMDLIDYIVNRLENFYKLDEEIARLKGLYRRTIEHLFKIGNDELARYFQAQINDCPSFIPQDIRGDK